MSRADKARKRQRRKSLDRRRRARLSWPERFDILAVERLEPWLRLPASRALGAIGKLADEPPLLLLSAALLVTGRARSDDRLVRTAERMLLAHLLTIAAKTIGKDHIDRSRPAALIEGGGYRMARGRSRDPALRSFPSGHTAGAVAVARALARSYPEHAGPLYLAAAALGALQVPRLAHFPTDILAGALIGWMGEALIHRALTVRSQLLPELEPSG